MGSTADYNKKRRERLRAQGLCAYCGKVESVTFACSACSKKFQGYAKKKRIQFQEQGLCPHCYGKRPAVEGKKACEPCLKILAAKTSKRIKKRKADGACALCGKFVPLKSKTLCADCAEMLVQKSNERRRQRLATGMCIYCGKNPREKSIQICRPCAGDRKLRADTQEEKEQERLRKIAKRIAYAQWLKDNKPANVKPKQWQVIELRFGLNDGIKRTLQEVGDVFGVSRERIRQIEEYVLGVISGDIVPFQPKPKVIRRSRRGRPRKEVPTPTVENYFADFYSGE